MGRVPQSFPAVTTRRIRLTCLLIRPVGFRCSPQVHGDCRLVFPHRSGRITGWRTPSSTASPFRRSSLRKSGAPYSAGVGGAAPGGLRAGITGGGLPSLSRFPLFSRNAFRMPTIVNVDLRISRRFRITNKANLEILGEAFNLLNRTQVTELNTRMYVAGGTAAASTLTFDPAFQTVRAAGNNVVRERQLQFGIRMGF